MLGPNEEKKVFFLSLFLCKDKLIGDDYRAQKLFSKIQDKSTIHCEGVL